MNTKKRMGIWMDHSGAELLEFPSDSKQPIKFQINDHRRQHEEGEKYDNESKLLNKEHNRTASFYKKIIAIIRDFDEILLFGPADAKSEFHNFLKKDPYFDQKEISVMTTDRLSEEEKHHFVTDYFKRFEIKNL